MDSLVSYTATSGASLATKALVERFNFNSTSDLMPRKPLAKGLLEINETSAQVVTASLVSSDNHPVQLRPQLRFVKRSA
jgi:hypothetical protein